MTAFLDGRVHLASPNAAEVVSSDGTKTYMVVWTDGMQEITSNDNASYWQGYIGYPIIAVLLATGKIPLQAYGVRWLSGVPWNKLNKEYRRNYEAAIEHVLTQIRAQGGDTDTVVAEVDRVFEELRGLSLQQLQARQKPPQ